MQFSRFFAARVPRDNDVTIHSLVETLHLDDPYAAPELGAGYAFADASTDAYSLALTFLERFTGVPAGELRATDGSVHLPDAQTWTVFTEEQTAELRLFFAAVLTLGGNAPKGTAAAQRLPVAECAAWLSRMATEVERGQIGPGTHLLHDRYVVIAKLGEGASARTFLVQDTVADELYTFKQLKRTADFPLALDEFKHLLRMPPHANVTRVYDVFPPESPVHVRLGYVPGSSLGDRIELSSGDATRCERLADDLLAALAHLDDNGLMHRDIKPANIILHRDTGAAVLIDFGIAARTDTAASRAGTPRYMAPELFTGGTPTHRSDLYAAAATVFEALTGQLPGDGIAALAGLSEEARMLGVILLRGAAPDAGERFATAAAFRTALPMHAPMPTPTTNDIEQSPAPWPAAYAVSPLTEVVNPWVNQLRGAYRNSTHGNADNRGLDSDFARETYIRTALDERLLPDLLTMHPRVVFLSGNPGDGKTAFLEQVRGELRQRGGIEHATDPSGWEWTHEGRTYRACYDASESAGGKSADEQLRARLAGYEGNTPGRDDLTVLVAINDGRYHAVADSLPGRFRLAHGPDGAGGK